MLMQDQNNIVHTDEYSLILLYSTLSLLQAYIMGIMNESTVYQMPMSIDGRICQKWSAEGGNLSAQPEGGSQTWYVHLTKINLLM